MGEPIPLRVVRPYSSVEEYLQAEAWTMDAKTVLLIGQDELAPGTMVRFEIVIDTGEKTIRAEGVVQKFVAARGPRPGGLRVRLKRIGAATKALIDRATEIRTTQKSLPPPPPSTRLDAPSDPVSVEAPLTEGPERSGVRHSVAPVEAPPNREELLSRLRERRRADAGEESA